MIIPRATILIALVAAPAGAQSADSTARADTARKLAPVTVEGRRTAPISVGGASAGRLDERGAAVASCRVPAGEGEFGLCVMRCP